MSDFSTFPRPLYGATKEGCQSAFDSVKAKLDLLPSALPPGFIDNSRPSKRGDGAILTFLLDPHSSWPPSPICCCLHRKRTEKNTNDHTHSAISFRMWESGFVNKFLRHSPQFHHQSKHNPGKSWD